MNRTFCRFSPVVLFLVVLAFIIPSPLTAAEKHFLWQARTDTATVYLFGSIHFMKKDSYPLNSIIEDAFERSDTLAVEADIRNISKESMEKVRLTGLYQGQDTLANHISRDAYEFVKTEAGRLGLPPAFFDRQRPWFLGMTLSALVWMRSGYDPRFGIDTYFLNRASGKKKVVELESFDYQVGLLAGLPDDEQESFLLYTVKDLSSAARQIESLISAWKTGDTTGMTSILESSVADDARLKVIYRKIMTDRNKTMAQGITRYLRSRGTYFVVVGAGHMVGDLGIVELLKKEGFTVDQL